MSRKGSLGLMKKNWQSLYLSLYFVLHTFVSLGIISQIIFPYNERIANIVSLNLSIAHQPDQFTQGLMAMNAQSNNDSSVSSQCATRTHLFYELLTMALLEGTSCKA